jgi:hypothetical protein
MAVFSIITSGGAEASGTAATTLVSYRVFESSGEGIYCGGQSLFKIGYHEDTSGGIESNGVADTSGAVVHIDFTVLWEIKLAYTVDTTFMWDTGLGTMSWYRVIGMTSEKCKPIVCDCIQVITNIYASSMGNLCQKLHDSGWKWPIKTVERWSDDHCTLTEVEICEHPLCGEFCLDADVSVSMGFEMQMIAMGNYFLDMDGGLNIAGDADASWGDGFTRFYYTGSGGRELSAGADYYTSAFYATGSGGREFSGSVIVACSHRSFIGGEWPSFERSVARVADTKTTSDGQAEWQDVENIHYTDGELAYVDLSNGRSSNFIVGKDFGLSIPENSTIRGIEVTVNRSASLFVKDAEVYLVMGDIISSDNKAKIIGQWPYVKTDSLYGGVSDDWRSQTRESYGSWTSDDLNSPDFGVAIRAVCMGSIANTFARIDSISVNVCYENSVQCQFIEMGGYCNWVAKNSHYAGTGTMSISGTSPVIERYTPRYVALSDPLVISGTYMRNFHYVTLVEDILLGDTAYYKTSWAEEFGSGGAIVGGQCTLSPYWWVCEEGGLVFGGIGELENVGYRYVPEASQIFIGEIYGAFSDCFSGSFDIEYVLDNLSGASYFYVPSGGILANGDARVISPAFQWESDGNIVFAQGSADTNYRGFGTLMVYAYGDMEIRNIVAELGSIGTPSVMPLLTGIIRECGCTAIPMLINMKHNLSINNKLSQFLARTKQGMPTVVPMLYNRVNDSWQANYHFDGWSIANPGGVETWNILFELNCTEEVGSIDTGQSLWSFSAQITQRESGGGQRLTKIMVVVAPTTICRTNSLNFSFNYNTLLNSVIISPDSILYQKLIYDNIGLFKNNLWNNNPILEISISQAILSRFIPETTVSPTMGGLVASGMES